MARLGCTTGTAGLAVAQAAVLETAVEHRMCVPNCLSTLPGLHVNYQAVGLVVAVASCRSCAAEARQALPAAVGEEEVGASSVEGGPEVIVWVVVEAHNLHQLLLQTHDAGLVDTSSAPFLFLKKGDMGCTNYLSAQSRYRP